MAFEIESVLYDLLKIIKVVPATLCLAIIILLISIILGSLLAIIKIKKMAILSPLITLFVSYVRGIPIVVHLLFINAIIPKILYHLLQIIGVVDGNVKVSSLIIILLTYILFETGMETENIRGLFRSFDYGQIEAALSIGLSPIQVLRRIVAPQLIKIGIPIFLNSFVKIIKNLSVAFTIGFVEIFASARYVAALNAAYLESYVAAGLIYWGICGVLQVICNHYEKRDYLM